MIRKRSVSTAQCSFIVHCASILLLVPHTTAEESQPPGSLSEQSAKFTEKIAPGDPDVVEIAPAMFDESNVIPMPLPNPRTMPHPAPQAGPPALPRFVRHNFIDGSTEYFERNDDAFSVTDLLETLAAPGPDWENGYQSEWDMTSNFTAPLRRTNPTTNWPSRANVKILACFRTTSGIEYVGDCSGTLIDSRHIITAAHCVYGHTVTFDDVEHTVNDWYRSLRVIPGKNDALEPFCDARAVSATTFTCYTADENSDCDLAIVELDRPVGALTGWFGYGTRGTCGFYTGKVFHNLSYPSDTPYEPGNRMYYQRGNFDRCETNLIGNWYGNEVRYNRLSYSGMSGSGFYNILPTNNRVVFAVLSNGTFNPGAYTNAARIDLQTFNMFMDNINSNTPANPDLIPLTVRSDDKITAGNRVESFDVLIHNYSSAAFAGNIAFDIRLSDNRTISTGDLLLGEATANGANIGAKATLRISIPAGQRPLIPLNTTSGVYYLGIVIRTFDADRGNNRSFVCDVARIAVNAGGACCMPDGSCTPNVSLIDCLVAGGMYQGNATTCTPNPCPQPNGACCLPDGTCRPNLTAGACAALGGMYKGDNSGCQPNPCNPIVGACCDSTGFCSIEIEAECNATGGTYQGDNTACDPNPCPQLPIGACCDETGTCFEITEDFCAFINGEYNGDNSRCMDVVCESDVGACCLPDESCVVLTALDCQQQNGFYLGANAACDDGACDFGAAGACCDPLFSICSIEAPPICIALDGIYLGDNTSCDPFPCDFAQGACCLPDGVCGLSNAAACANAGGAYQGDGTLCTPNVCPALPTGACCTQRGECYETNEFECNMNGYDYQGDGTACGNVPCAAVPVGACCRADGSCSVELMTDCDATDSIFLGSGTDCASAPCAALPRGACCDNAGGCTIELADVCTNTARTYQGDDTACAMIDCPVAGLLGDLNCDGFVGLSDIGPFILAIQDAAAYTTTFPECLIRNGDFNDDGAVTASDIGGFVRALTTNPVPG